MLSKNGLLTAPLECKYQETYSFVITGINAVKLKRRPLVI